MQAQSAAANAAVSKQYKGRRNRRMGLAGLAGCLATLLWGCHGEPSAGAGETQNTSGAAQTTKTVTLTTADNWKIVGDLYAAGNNSPAAVILLHQRGGQASDWVPLCRALQKAGITALAIDQRGAGRSVQGPGQTGKEAPWPTGSDIAAFVAYLHGGEQSKSAVGLAGASYGANNALIYAAGHASQIRALALYSPGANYHGLDALAAARACRTPVVVYHDKNDAIAGKGPAQIIAALPSERPGDVAFRLPGGGHGVSRQGSERTLRVLSGSEHGTGLLTSENIQDTVAFFQRTLK